MKKLSQEQIDFLMEMRNGFENQLTDINEMIKQNSKIHKSKNNKIYEEIIQVKTRVLNSIMDFNENVVNALKVDNFDVPDSLYISI